MSEQKCEPFLRLIYLMGQDLRNHAEKILSPYQVTLEQFQILKSLDITTGYSQRVLGDAVSKTPANVTRILDRLEDKEVLIRKDHPEDRRTSLVFLTQKGQAIVEEAIGVFDSFSRQITSGISEHEQATVRDAFTKMSLNMNKISTDK